MPPVSPSRLAVFKIFYLVAVTAAVFTLPATSIPMIAQRFVLSAMLTAQAVILLACRVPGSDILRPVWRLKWLLLFLIMMYGLLPPERPCCDALFAWPIPLPAIQWTVSINLSGVEKAAFMCIQILTVLLASTLVRATGTGRDLIEGLRAFRLPDLFVHSLDRTLETFVGARRPGHRRGPSSNPGFYTQLKQVIRGDFSVFVQKIERNMALVAEPVSEAQCARASLNHDVPIVAGIALCMASFKMLKVLPGLPFASGHKTFLLFPLYVLAARLTHSRWGATAVGSIMGVIGFVQGDGRFGILEIFKHIAPGIVIDLSEPFVRRFPSWAFGYCLLGLAAAIARTATELLLVLLLGARAEIYIFPAAKLIPNLLAGLLSGFVTVFVLRAFASAKDVRAEVTIVTEIQPASDVGDVAASKGSDRTADAKPGLLIGPSAVQEHEPRPHGSGRDRGSRRDQGPRPSP